MVQAASGNTVSRTGRAVLRPVTEASIMAKEGRGPTTQSSVPSCPSKGDSDIMPRYNQDSRSSGQFVAETDMRSSQGVSMDMIRSGGDERCQIQLSDCQASSWWQCRPKVRLGSKLPNWDPVQEGPWAWTSTAVTHLETEAGKEGRAETGLLSPWAGVGMKLPGEQVRASKGCKCILTHRQFHLNKMHFFHCRGGQAV